MKTSMAAPILRVLPLAAVALLITCGAESETQESQADGALLVGNLTTPAPHAGNGILRYRAASGAFVDAFAAEGTGPAGSPLLGPCCMVFGPDENLYVGNLFGVAIADRGVFRYNGATGEFMDVFVPGGSGCDDPHDIIEHPECRP